MPKDESWVGKLLSEVVHSHPLMTEAAVTRIRGLLQGTLSEHPLSPKALAEVARALINDMSILSDPTKEDGFED